MEIIGKMSKSAEKSREFLRNTMDFLEKANSSPA